jgi:hypothetical protein
MAKVFISYSRKDIEFAKKLTGELQKSDLDFWVDWEGIPPTVDWWKEIEKGIEEADVFLFLISPDSSASKVCGQEIDCAVKNSKRIIPLVVREEKGSNAPQQLSHLNWIFFREQDDFNAAIQKLQIAIHTDYEWVQTHRRLQVKALEWERNHKEKSFLLRGKELHDAEFQLMTNAAKGPAATELQHSYIHASRKLSDQQRRLGTLLAIATAIAMFVLAVYGLQSAQKAKAESERANLNEQREIIAKNHAMEKEIEAHINQLSALAVTKIDQNYNEALLLGVEAYRRAKENQIGSYTSQDAITKIIQSNPGLTQILLGHADWVNVMALDAERHVLISGSWDSTIIVWDITIPESPVKLATLTEHFNPIDGMAFSSDGKILASSSADALILWDMSNPSQPEMISKINGGYSSIHFTKDAQSLVLMKYGDSNYASSIILLNISNKEAPVELIEFNHGDESAEISSLEFNPDRNLLYSSLNNGNVLEWDLTERESPRLLYTLVGSGEVSSLKISVDGNILAVGYAEW